MLIKLAHRKILLEILAENGKRGMQGGFPSHLMPVDPIYDENIYLIWGSDINEPKNLPIIIIVPDGHLRDFLAWVSTYLPNYRPFTAFFRVLELETAITFPIKIDNPSMGNLDTACIGLILGEALTLSAELSKRSSLSPISCSSTISYCLARAMAIGLKEKEIDFITDRWLLTRKITDQPERNLNYSTIKYIWKIIFNINNRDYQVQEAEAVSKLLIEACFQLKDEGRINNNLWKLLTNDIEELKPALKEMTLPREDRVVYFQSLITKNSFSKLNDKNLQSFVCGYLASLIGPGSMSHLDLIEPKLSQMSDIVLWYGLCAGLHKNNELLGSFNVLGRRLLRDLLKPESLLSRPSADISISELQVLLDGQIKTPEFRTFSPQHILVELMPYISTYLSWPKRETIQQKVLFPQHPLLSKLQFLLKEAMEIQKLLSGPGGLSENKFSYKKSSKKDKKKTI